MPTWSIVSAALAVVAIAVVLALAFGGGSGSGSRGAATPATKDGGARADADTVDPQLHPSDLGNGWVPVRIEPLTAEDLDPSDDCWPALSTEPRATFGIGEQFSYRLKSDGTEFGHLAENVTEYPSAASTRVVLGNRNDPLFEPCVDADDRSYLTGDTDTTDVTSTPLVRTIITGATVYHHQLNYTYRGTPSAMEFWSVFFGAGRFKFTLYLSGNLDVGTVDNIINAAIRRLQTAANS